jgi:hypothetical protein
MNKNFAKVQLSAEEMRLVRDPAWILTKNSVMGKVIAMFGELSGEIRIGGAHRVAPIRRAPGSGGTEPKISRGENYKGLPWVMLDYPRVFGKEDVYAIRLMFLWGHAFSVTLHLKGVYKERLLPGIRLRWAELAAAGFEYSISDDEWAHEHTAETYGPWEGTHERSAGGIEEEDARAADTRSESSERGMEGMPHERPWLKLSARVGLEHWDEAPERLSALHQLLMEVSCYPDGGISP